MHVMNESAPSSQTIRVFLVDGQEIVRRGLCDLLDAEPGIQVVGEAGSADTALARIPAARPDVAIMEVRLPDHDGVRVCQEIRARAPEVACLMLTDLSDDRAFRDAVMAGCAGYILKGAEGASLAKAVRTVASGQPALDPQTATRLVTWVQDQIKVRDRLARLTFREQQVLALLGEGLTNRQIGQRLTLAEATIKNYVSSLLTKLDMRHRTEAAAFAVRMAAEHVQPPSRPASHVADAQGRR